MIDARMDSVSIRFNSLYMKGPTLIWSKMTIPSMSRVARTWKIIPCYFRYTDITRIPIFLYIMIDSQKKNLVLYPV